MKRCFLAGLVALAALVAAPAQGLEPDAAGTRNGVSASGLDTGRLLAWLAPRLDPAPAVTLIDNHLPSTGICGGRVTDSNLVRVCCKFKERPRCDEEGKCRCVATPSCYKACEEAGNCNAAPLCAGIAPTFRRPPAVRTLPADPTRRPPRRRARPDR